jgi:hypothetical protein
LILTAVPLCLLPMVMPGNLVFNATLAISIIWIERHDLKRFRRDIAIITLASIAGGCFYFTIWEQFKSTMSNTTGWDSGPEVLAHLLLVVALFVIPLVISVVWAAKSSAEKPVESPVPVTVRTFLKSFLITAIVLITTVILVKAPFPRTMLVFAGPFAALSMLLYRRDLLKDKNCFYK